MALRNENHNLASPDGDDIDVGGDATPEPKPSRTQQDIPDASRDARHDVDLGSMTAQKWSQEQLQEPVCKSTITLLQQGLGGASPQDIILQFPTRVRSLVQQVLELAAKTKLFTTEGNFSLLVKRNTSSAELSHSGGRVPPIYVPMLFTFTLVTSLSYLALGIIDWALRSSGGSCGTGTAQGR